MARGGSLALSGFTVRSHRFCDRYCSRLFIEKSTQFFDMACPGRFVWKRNMTIAIDFDEAGTRNAARQHESELKRVGHVTAAVQHEGRNGDLRQQCDDVQVADRA